MQKAETGKRAGARNRAPVIAIVALGVFAWVWAMIRAHVQVMTGDEAESYELYVAANAQHWTPASNNHLLNSLLERASTSVFGLSHLSVRAPALLGAALYIVVALWLTGLVCRNWRVRIPLFACLVYNPFIFDFFVAARGYGLALAFLLLAIALASWWQLEAMRGRKHSAPAVCALSSTSIALAFTANFAFAFIDAAAMLSLLAWAVFVAPAARTAAAPRWRLLAAAILPAVAVVLLLPSWTLLHWPPNQLQDGTTSLREALKTVVRASLFEPNRNLLNPLLFPSVEKIRRFLIPLAGLAALAQFIFVFAPRSKAHRGRRAWLAGTATALGAMLGLTLAAHWLAFHWFGLYYPWHRTAIWIVPPATLLIGIAAALPVSTRLAAAGRRAVIAMMVALSVYFVLCMRLTYFREWDYQQDLKKTYDVVACYNHNRGVRDVEVSWWYHAGMNFYWLLSGRENLTPFTNTQPHPTDRLLYVLNGGWEQDFIKAQNLRVVYKGESSDIVVAVRPEIADAAQGACYIQPPL